MHRNKIAQNVNADEAVVLGRSRSSVTSRGPEFFFVLLGAAFYGATLSPQFRTKDIRVTDIIIHDLQASYFAAPSAADARPRTISTLIFPAGSKVDTKKTLTFKRKEDFSVWLDHRMPPAPCVAAVPLVSYTFCLALRSRSGFPTSILEVEIKGVAEALANLTQRGAVDPVIKANVSLSKSSFVSVQEAVAFGEVKDETLAGTSLNCASSLQKQLSPSGR